MNRIQKHVVQGFFDVLLKGLLLGAYGSVGPVVL